MGEERWAVEGAGEGGKREGAGRWRRTSPEPLGALRSIIPLTVPKILHLGGEGASRRCYTLTHIPHMNLRTWDEPYHHSYKRHIPIT